MVIKDQSEPFWFQVAVEGCQPTIEIDKTTLDFEKLLLSQTKTLKMELKNTGKISAFWSLNGVKVAGTNFTFNQLECVINPRQSFAVSCKYGSSKPFSINKPVTLEIFDLGKTRLFTSKQINFSAESFEVNFDFQYPKGLDHLQFGSLKVGQSQEGVISPTDKPIKVSFTL